MPTGRTFSLRIVQRCYTPSEICWYDCRNGNSTSSSSSSSFRQLLLLSPKQHNSRGIILIGAYKMNSFAFVWVLYYLNVPPPNTYISLIIFRNHRWVLNEGFTSELTVQDPVSNVYHHSHAPTEELDRVRTWNSI